MTTKPKIYKSIGTNDQKRNSQKPNSCPVDGNCNMENDCYLPGWSHHSMYNHKGNIGLSDTNFELRYRNYVLCSFRNEQYKHATELSTFVST